MIRLGICTSIDHAAVMKEIGYDYVELGMTQVAQLSDADCRAADQVKAAPLPVEAMNGMIPAEYPLCCPEGTGKRVQDYLAGRLLARRSWACALWCSAPAGRAPRARGRDAGAGLLLSCGLSRPGGAHGRAARAVHRRGSRCAPRNATSSTTSPRRSIWHSAPGSATSGRWRTFTT